MEVELSFPPESIQGYAEQMVADAEEKNYPPANIAMLKYIVTLIKVAKSVMTPSPKPTKTK